MQNLFSIQTVAIFVVIALPGIIGQMAYALTISKPIDALQNQLVSIFAFGCLNFVVVAWLLLNFVGYPFVPADFNVWAALVSIVCLVFVPLILGWSLAWAVKVASARGLITFGIENEWDFAFNWAKDQPGEIWFLVETNGGDAFAARYDDDTYATTGKTPRGAFFSRTWRLDENGEFDTTIEPTAVVLSESQLVRIGIRRLTGE